jgi:thymidylate kinase
MTSRVVAAGFAALDAHDVRWCLLRGFAETSPKTTPPSPTGGATGRDLDLLVAPADLDRAAAALRTAGYAQVPGWSGPSHRQFVAYDADDDRWIRFDASGELSFGAGRLVAADPAPVLARSVTVEGARRPAPDDRFWALLAHDLLDHESAVPRHLEELRRIAPEVIGTGDLGAAFVAQCPGGWDAGRILEAVRSEDGGSLGQLGAAIRGRRSRGHQVASVFGEAMDRVGRRVTRIPGQYRRGVVVTLLGPNGAGKSTLAERLSGSFPFRAQRLYLGLYGRGALDRQGTRARRFPGVRMARRVLWLLRLRATAAFHRARGRLVILDRHPAEGLVIGYRRSHLDAVRRRVLAAAGPAPGLAIILDAPADVLAERKAEHPLERLDDQRRAYLELAHRLPNAVIVDASADAEHVRRTVVALIWRYCAERWRVR